MSENRSPLLCNKDFCCSSEASGKLFITRDNYRNLAKVSIMANVASVARGLFKIVAII